MKPHEQHRMKAPKHVNVALVTVSSSRFMAKASYEKPSDESGDVAEREITSLGHRVVSRNLISDDRKMILNSVSRFLKGDGDVLIFLGGTGISKRDITIETVSPLLEKELPGFGELFRASSYREIGPAAMLTRATAGTVKGRVVICLPGSPDAALLAIRAFGTELPHAVGVART